MKTKRTLQTLLAGAVAISALGVAGDAVAKEGFEKCFGVVKAAHNDCGAADKSHSCAGQASADGSMNEWIYLPEGICDKLVGGSTQGGEKAADMDKMHSEGAKSGDMDKMHSDDAESGKAH